MRYVYVISISSALLIVFLLLDYEIRSGYTQFFFFIIHTGFRSLDRIFRVRNNNLKTLYDKKKKTVSNLYINFVTGNVAATRPFEKKKKNGNGTPPSVVIGALAALLTRSV